MTLGETQNAFLEGSYDTISPYPPEELRLYFSGSLASSFDLDKLVCEFRKLQISREKSDTHRFFNTFILLEQGWKAVIRRVRKGPSLGLKRAIRTDMMGARLEARFVEPCVMGQNFQTLPRDPTVDPASFQHMHLGERFVLVPRENEKELKLFEQLVISLLGFINGCQRCWP